MITRHEVAKKMAAYLQHQLSLPQLVDWAETVMMDEEFEARDFAAVREAVARLGLADVRAFGLTWEDCQDILQNLGYSASVDVSAA
jgi:hypothetical protein